MQRRTNPLNLAHRSHSDELGILASQVVARIAPNRNDRATAGDCYQQAYLAGLQARRAAERSGSHTSREVLAMTMTDRVYRLLKKRKDIREADLPA